MRSLKRTIVVGVAAVLLGSVLGAEAASVRVRCEKRLSPARSKVSVDASGLAAGRYRARVVSGTHAAISAAKAAVAGEAQFDFDSNPANIADGATKIGSGFLQGNPPQVSAAVLNSATDQAVARGSATCQVR